MRKKNVTIRHHPKCVLLDKLKITAILEIFYAQLYHTITHFVLKIIKLNLSCLI